MQGPSVLSAYLKIIAMYNWHWTMNIITSMFLIKSKSAVPKVWISFYGTRELVGAVHSRKETALLVKTIVLLTKTFLALQ